MMKKKLCAALAAVLVLSLLCACSKPAPEEQVDLDAFVQSVMENHQFSGFMERMDPEDADAGEMMKDMLDNFYPGLTDLELEQMEVYLSMISFSSGELALVQAKSADDTAAVKDIFEARMTAKTEDGPGNYPAEVELWQSSSALVGRGNYVMLVCHEDCDAIVDEFNALFPR